MPDVRAPLGAAGRAVRRNLFLAVAVVAAAVSCVLVPPDAEYLDYPEYRTLLCLLCLLAVVGALERVHVVAAGSEQVLRVLRSRRSLVTGLVLLTLVASMFLTNDMALVALLPLAYTALRSVGDTEHVPYVFVLQTVAANLGGMITPFGSPQNLFLYQFYGLTAVELARTMAVPFVVSVVAIVLLCRLVPDAPVAASPGRTTVDRPRTVVYVALFVLTAAMVLRLVPLWAGLVVLVVLAVLDRRALLRVDVGLLLTFVMFFVFAGNLARVPEVEQWLGSALDTHVLWRSALASQVASNVPTAVLFAHFTDDSRQLLVGVNVGGVGTVVASLASLITLRRLQVLEPARVRRFLALFTLVNVGLLALLLAVSSALFATGLL